MRKAILVFLAFLVGTIPACAATGAAEGMVKTAPTGEYRVVTLALAGALPDSMPGKTKALQVYAAFRDGKAVYCFGRARAAWERTAHIENKLVQMDASGLSFDGTNLKGTLRTGEDWGYWPAEFTVTATVDGNGAAKGTYEGKYLPSVGTGQVTGTRMARAERGADLQVTLAFASIYDSGLLRNPTLRFTVRNGKAVDGQLTGNRDPLTTTFQGGNMTFDGHKLAGTVQVRVTDGNATHGLYTFALDGTVTCNAFVGAAQMTVEDRDWGVRPCYGTVQGTEEPSASDCVYALSLPGALEDVGTIQAFLDNRKGRIAAGYGSYGFGKYTAADVTNTRIARGKLVGSLTLTLDSGIGWPYPLPCTYTLEMPIDKADITGTFASSYAQGTACQGDVTGTVRDEARMRRQFGLPATSIGWPSWPGPTDDFTGSNPEVDLVNDLAQARLVWASEGTITQGREAADASDATNLQKMRYVYGGYASLVVGGGRVYQFFMDPSGSVADEALVAKSLTVAKTPEDQAFVRRRWAVNADDVVLCTDAATGKTLWQCVFPEKGINWTYGNKHATVNMTPCYADGRLYVLGGAARVYCLDAATGALIWDVPLEPLASKLEVARQAALQAKRLVSGDAAEPFENFLEVADGVLFTRMAGSTIVAMDAVTGKALWTTPGDACGRWVYKGKAYILTGGANKINCVEPKTGTVLWTINDVRVPQATGYFATSGDVLLAAGTAVPANQPKDAPLVLEAYRMTDQGAQKLWTNTELPAGISHGHPINFYRGCAYIKNQQTKTLFQIDLQTGKTLAKVEAGFTWGSIGFVGDGRLYTMPDGTHETAGNVIIVHTAPGLQAVGGWEPWHRPTTAYDVPNTYPLVDGLLFIRGSKRLYCYDLRKE